MPKLVHDAILMENPSIQFKKGVAKNAIRLHHKNDAKTKIK